VEFIEAKDIDRLVAFGQARTGDDHVAADVLRARLERQPGCVAALRGAAAEATAFSILYALTEEATADVLNRRVVNGSMLQLAHLARESATSIYIGSLVSAPGWGVRALDLELHHLSWLLARHPNAAWLFGRAATPSGAKLLDRLHFAPLSTPSQIQAHHLPPSEAALIRQLVQHGRPARVWLHLLDHVDDRRSRHDDL
jgi:hypothetical protein